MTWLSITYKKLKRLYIKIFKKRALKLLIKVIQALKVFQPTIE